MRRQKTCRAAGAGDQAKYTVVWCPVLAQVARLGFHWIYALCESSGYLYNFLVYFEKGNLTLDDRLVQCLGKPRAKVAQILQPYIVHGCHWYLDNWYSSMVLAAYLRKKGTAECGTIRRNRDGLLKNVPECTLRQFPTRSSDGMLFLKLYDTKKVGFLATNHSENVAPTGKGTLSMNQGIQYELSSNRFIKFGIFSPVGQCVTCVVLNGLSLAFLKNAKK